MKILLRSRLGQLGIRMNLERDTFYRIQKLMDQAKKISKIFENSGDQFGHKPIPY
jgi:hypothetical protein